MRRTAVFLRFKDLWLDLFGAGSLGDFMIHFARGWNAGKHIFVND